MRRSSSIGIPRSRISCQQGRAPDDETTTAVAEALRVGYRSIDTAAIYGNETGVGRAIAESGIARDDLFITSKVWNTDQGYDSTLRAYDETLTRLGLEQLDLYLIHWPAPALDLYVDTWRALERILADGRVRAIGVSNFEPAHLERLITMSTVVPAVNQVELHPAMQNRAVIAANSARGIATEAWSPLAQGAVLRWHLQQGRIVIPKSVTASRIAENHDVLGFDLSAEGLTALDGLERDGRTGPHPDEFNG